MSKPRDSFDPAPPREPQRVTRLDVRMKVIETGESGSEVNTVTMTYEYRRPDTTSQAEFVTGPLADHLNNGEITSTENMLNRLMGRLNP